MAWPGAPRGADVDQRTDEHVSEDGMNSQDVAFETLLGAQFQGRGPDNRMDTSLRSPPPACFLVASRDPSPYQPGGLQVVDPWQS
jgi:hypothetical protein